MHIKAKGMTQFDIFHVFVENSVNSELCFSELYSNQPKSEIYPKMPMFEQLKVHIFWEGHKILHNLHQLFDWHYMGQN